MRWTSVAVVIFAGIHFEAHAELSRADLLQQRASSIRSCQAGDSRACERAKAVSVQLSLIELDRDLNRPERAAAPIEEPSCLRPVTALLPPLM